MNLEELTLETGQDGLNRVISRVRKMDSILPVTLQGELAKSQPVFIFVPGILGSKLLTKSGDVIWGTLSASGEKLFYDPDQPVDAELLENYDALISKIDVYGEFFRSVDLMNVGNVKHLLYFPYDWRQDNRKSAQEFDQKFFSDGWKDILINRKIVVIAHSMGGLVTKYWYHKFYSGNETRYPFKQIRVIFIGTPHMGAPSSLATLIEGYTTDLAAGWFFKCFQTNTIFKSLSRAGHTFPSIYQLLPVYNPELVMLKTKTNDETDVPIFDIESWIKFDWLKKWRDSKKAKRVFYEKIQPLLEDGKKFHEEIHKRGLVPNAVYYYSKNHKTLTRIIVHETKKGAFETKFILEDSKGDGRVPRNVAINLYGSELEPDARGLKEKHGSLPRDVNFIDYIKLTREAALRRSRSRLAVIALQNPQVLSAFAMENVLLDVPLDTDKWDTKSILKIKEVNRQVLERIMLFERIDLKPEAFIYKSANNVQDPFGRARLYALLVALDPQENIKYFASSKLASLLIHEEDFQNARNFANIAVKIKPTGLMKKELWRTQRSIYENLNVIHSHLGHEKAALQSCKKAAYFNDLLGDLEL